MARLEITNYSMARGAAYREAMLQLDQAPGKPPARVSADGLALRDAILNTMQSGELLAGYAGVVPMIKLGDGSYGIVELGAARALIRDPSKWDKPGGQTLNGEPLTAKQRDAVINAYLAVTQAASQANASVVKGRGNAPEILPATNVGGITGLIVNANNSISVLASQFGLTAPASPVIAWPVVVIVVVAIAAVIGGAWYSSVSKAEIESDKAIQLAKVGRLSDLALMQISAGKDPDQAIIEQLGGAGTLEKHRWAYYLGAGVVGLGLGGVVIYSIANMAGSKPRRRKNPSRRRRRRRAA